MIYILIWTAVLLAVLTLYFRQTYSRFSKYGVKNMKVVPFFGNMTRMAFQMDHLAEQFDKIYKAFPDERFVGRFEFSKPTLFIHDLELVKKITIKDFDYFLDHRGFTDEKVEPLFGRNLFSLKGQEWKDMRSTLSPAFTSSKIKLMVPFMVEVGEQMIRTLKKKIRESDGYIDVDCKDLTSRFATDVIASCAFGLKVDSQTEKENQFYLMGKAASTIKFRQLFLFFALSACPSLIKILKLTMFSNKTRDFFIDLVLNTMKDREARGIFRPDMIHLLMEAKKGKLSHDENGSDDSYQDTGFATVEESSTGKRSIDRAWSDIDLVAQAVLFFIGGFETISISMSFALRELALHPEVQERLAKEIREHHAKNGGKLNFNSIQNMTYMDMVTSGKFQLEVLRLWPPGIGLERVCAKDYNMGKPNDKAEKDFIMRKGELLWIPVWCYHYDPKYFPNPNKFDPERFSNENKHKINPMAYLPFGLGPRNCIGSRFALCEMKALLYQILLHIEVSPSEKTVLSRKLATNSFNIRLAGGYWFRFKILFTDQPISKATNHIIIVQLPPNNSTLYCCVPVRRMIYILIWSAVLLAVLALYFRKTYSRFKDCGVKHIEVVPFFGNMTRVAFRMDHFTENFDKTYKAFPKERFVGRYEFTRPTIFIQDLELVKKVTVKDFEYFLDHRGFTDEKVEPLFGRNLFSLKGQEWKDMRSTLSPAFTSSKIKLMVPFMEEVGEQMVRNLKKKIEEWEGFIEVDCKDLTSRFATDVIASCAFGLKVDSQTEKKNKFYEMGKSASTFKLRQMLLFFTLSACPFLVKIFKITLFSNETKDFFIDLVLNTMKDRDARSIIRPDMIHLLMEAKKGRLSHEEKGSGDNYQDTGFATVEESSIGKKTIDRAWSDIDLVAQAVLFFIGGFETVSTAMSFAMRELALHPEVQDRLAKEIREHHAKHGGKLNFNSIQNMTYMDMVISEVLRLWPPAIALDRICTKDYNMGKPNDNAEKDFIMRKGEVLWIPVWCFHHDPKYFPNPYKFDPERFSNENKHKINPMAYMPFGLGPRNCIGSRFALCEIKALLYQILLHIEIYPSEKTVFSRKCANDSFNIRLAGGYWFRFKIRK
ncbi:uncharacterized protein LOC125065894 [Vanessa atalanta]|uniref:uncharacterized protein LOC125065894 n=1 Tax=Vanessa atalanta TaxID=42275 RepID=UPI001FCDDFE5|nr:uncharacterized protein LOC125065894 [Vanessa atalanta]